MKNVIKTTLLALALMTPMAVNAAGAPAVTATGISNAKSRRAERRRAERASLGGALAVLPKVILTNHLAGYLNEKDLTALGATAKYPRAVLHNDLMLAQAKGNRHVFICSINRTIRRMLSSGIIVSTLGGLMVGSYSFYDSNSLYDTIKTIIAGSGITRISAILIAGWIVPSIHTPTQLNFDISGAVAISPEAKHRAFFDAVLDKTFGYKTDDSRTFLAQFYKQIGSFYIKSLAATSLGMMIWNWLKS